MQADGVESKAEVEPVAVRVPGGHTARCAASAWCARRASNPNRPGKSRELCQLSYGRGCRRRTRTRSVRLRRPVSVPSGADGVVETVGIEPTDPPVAGRTLCHLSLRSLGTDGRSRTHSGRGWSPARHHASSAWGGRRGLNPRTRGHGPVLCLLSYDHHGPQRRTRTSDTGRIRPVL
jgi:hypothetical protein